jgi:hypothetical protein
VEAAAGYGVRAFRTSGSASALSRSITTGVPTSGLLLRTAAEIGGEALPEARAACSASTDAVTHRPVTFPPGTGGPPGVARRRPGGNAPWPSLRQGMKQPDRFSVTETGAETFPAASTATTAKVFSPLTLPYSNTWV